MKFQTIQPTALQAMQSSGRGVDLIDVRTPAEFAQVHAEGAVNVPLDTITPDAVRKARTSHADGPVYVICKSGGRSSAACQQLLQSGLDVVNVEGGTMAWEKAGLPVVRSGRGGRSKLLRPLGVAVALVLLVLGFTVHFAYGMAAAGLWFVMVAVGGCPLGACSLPTSKEDVGNCCAK